MQPTLSLDRSIEILSAIDFLLSKNLPVGPSLHKACSAPDTLPVTPEASDQELQELVCRTSEILRNHLQDGNLPPAAAAVPLRWKHVSCCGDDGSRSTLRLEFIRQVEKLMTIYQEPPCDRFPQAIKNSAHLQSFLNKPKTLRPQEEVKGQLIVALDEDGVLGKRDPPRDRLRVRFDFEKPPYRCVKLSLKPNKRWKQPSENLREKLALTVLFTNHAMERTWLSQTDRLAFGRSFNATLYRRMHDVALRDYGFVDSIQNFPLSANLLKRNFPQQSPIRRAVEGICIYGSALENDLPVKDVLQRAWAPGIPPPITADSSQEQVEAYLRQCVQCIISNLDAASRSCRALLKEAPALAVLPAVWWEKAKYIDYIENINNSSRLSELYVKQVPKIAVKYLNEFGDITTAALFNFKTMLSILATPERMAPTEGASGEGFAILDSSGRIARAVMGLERIELKKGDILVWFAFQKALHAPMRVKITRARSKVKIPRKIHECIGIAVLLLNHSLERHWLTQEEIAAFGGRSEQELFEAMRQAAVRDYGSTLGLCYFPLADKLRTT